MNKCEKCGFLHYRTDPCRVAKDRGPISRSADSAPKSTAARKDVRFERPIAKRTDKAATAAEVESGSELDGSNLSASPAQGERPTPQARSAVALHKGAGTQALPVDTNSAKADSEPHITAGLRAPDTGVAGNHPASGGPAEANGAIKLAKPRGRPRIHPDRKAAKAMYERNRRARLKNA